MKINIGTLILERFNNPKLSKFFYFIFNNKNMLEITKNSKSLKIKISNAKHVINFFQTNTHTHLAYEARNFIKYKLIII